MDILRIATSGSVDDGKSTLIGRLLYDTNSITKDKLEAIEASSKRKGLDFTDLSLLTDGLIAEREQGITIDVAHIYFATENRKYIIADTPGHIEYTRNMVTGASTAEASMILIDARNGVIEQTRRHLFISSLLRIRTVFVCINKMDLVEFDEQVFNTIKSQVNDLAEKIQYQGALHFIPIAAKQGANVVHASDNMKWYQGKTLLQYLEELPAGTEKTSLPARFPVQYVIRPHSDVHHDFRGYAGRLVSGTLRIGDKVTVLPTLKQSVIKQIHIADKQAEQAMAGDSVSLELEDDVDVSRGNMIVHADGPHQQVSQFTARITWMDEQALIGGKSYLLQHGINVVKSKITSLQSVVNMQTLEENNQVAAFQLNDIGKVTIKTAKPIFADLFEENPFNGAFILIDEFSNNTVGVGFIESF